MIESIRILGRAGAGFELFALKKAEVALLVVVVIMMMMVMMLLVLLLALHFHIRRSGSKPLSLLPQPAVLHLQLLPKFMRIMWVFMRHVHVMTMMNVAVNSFAHQNQ